MKNKITEDDLLACWGDYYMEYFLEILNEKYPIEDAISDLRGLIGSKYDKRNENSSESAA